MKKFIAIPVLCFVTLFISACGGTEIDNNPAPIVWGGTTFQPKSIEKSRKQQVYNQVSFSGYGKNGTIEKVVTTPDQTVVENIKMPGYSAEKVVFKGISGDFREAFNFYLSGRAETFFLQPDDGNVPRVHLDGFSASNETYQHNGARVEIGSVESRDLSIGKVGRTEAADIVVREGGHMAKIGRLAFNRVEVPEEIENNPENMLIDNLSISDISVPALNLTVEKIRLNYAENSLDTSIDNASAPGAILALVGITNPPAVLNASFSGSAKVSKKKIQAQAALDLKNLLDLKFDLTGSLDNRDFDRLNFTLKDLGALPYLSQKTVAELSMLGMFVPGGNEAIQKFLSRPGQTLTGSIVLVPGEEDFKFTVK